MLMCFARLPMTSSRLLKALPLVVLWGSCAPTHGVELEQLWVPKSYLRHLPRLYDAAQLVEDSSRCTEFLEGTVAVDQSELEQPVFKLTCRNRDHQTYSLLVDGGSLEKLDDTRPGGSVSFAQLEEEYQQERERQLERERKRQELAERRARQRREAEERERREAWLEAERLRWERLWEVCKAGLQERVGRMSKLEWLTDAMPQPEFASEPEVGDQPPVTFTIDFNAEDVHGAALSYQAQCTVEDAEQYQLDIGPRKDAGEKSAAETAENSPQ